MSESKTCYCVGPENCKDGNCSIVRQHRAAADRAEERLKQAMEEIFDKFVGELEQVCTADDDEYQDLENDIVGEEPEQLVEGTLLPYTEPYRPMPYWCPYNYQVDPPIWTTTTLTFAGDSVKMG